MKRSQFIRKREDCGSLNYIRMADLTIQIVITKVYIAYLRGGKFGNNYFEKIFLNEKFIEIKKGKEEGKVRIIATRNET